MSFAPQHDWTYYDARSRTSDADWLRASTPSERAALYVDLFNLLWNARNNVPGNWDLLEQRQWEEKLAIRRRMVEAFAKLDQWRSEQASANDAR